MSRFVDLQIPTADGRVLGARCVEPNEAPKGQIVLHGATAVPQAFYRHFAAHLGERGFRVLTYDYRGVGASRTGPVADDPVTMRDWIDDASAAQRWLHDRAPGLPLVAIGHSFGGQIAAAIEGGRRADALVLVASQSGFVGRFPQPTRTRVWLSFKVLTPAMTGLLGYLPGWSGLGEDLPSGVANQWARWCLDREYFLSELPELGPRLRSFDGRVLALSFTDDGYAPLENVKWLLERLGSAQIEHHHLEPLAVGMAQVGHFGLFRRAAAEDLWPRVDAFLDGIAQPSGQWHGATDAAMREVLADLQYGR